MDPLEWRSAAAGTTGQGRGMSTYSRGLLSGSNRVKSCAAGRGAASGVGLSGVGLRVSGDRPESCRRCRSESVG